jgi:hypothetical protein
MENIPNTNPIPTPQPPIQQKKPKKRVSTKVLLLIIVFLFILLLISAGILAYQNGYFDTILKKEDQNTEQDTENTNTEENTDEESKTNSVSFEGDTIKATIPEGWSIKEYYNGEGTEALPEGQTYTGLTGLKIYRGETEIFTVRAVSGVGFVGCPMYVQFADYNPNHLTQNQSIAEEIGEEMNITDYSDTEYVQFDWLGKTFRRVGISYFYDEQEGNNFFEAGCVSGLLTLEGLNFMHEDGEIGESYFYGASSEATEKDLQTVDEILQSMTLK